MRSSGASPYRPASFVAHRPAWSLSGACLLGSLVATPLHADPPNPHIGPDQCAVCHSGTPTPGDLQLKQRDIDALCGECHEPADHIASHSLGDTLAGFMQQAMPEAMRKRLDRRGRIGCTTCHAIEQRCREPRRRGPRGMLRAAGDQRSDFCYNCHPRDDYTRLNPHDHVNADGSFVKDKCLLCHQSIPSGHGGNDLLRIDYGRAELCLNCHRKVDHPADSPRHLGRPTDAIRSRIEQFGTEMGVRLPLEPSSGKIYCATCHNPHAGGVIDDPLLAQGAGADMRLRNQHICFFCHEL